MNAKSYQDQRRSHLFLLSDNKDAMQKSLLQKLSDTSCFLILRIPLNQIVGAKFHCANDEVSHEALCWFCTAVVRSKETTVGVETYPQSATACVYGISQKVLDTNEPICICHFIFYLWWFVFSIGTTLTPGIFLFWWILTKRQVEMMAVSKMT